MENSIKAILIAASILITMAIVSVGLIVLKSGQNLASESVNNINKMNRLIETEYTMYDNNTVSGNDVVSAIDKVLSSGDYVGILVTTKAGGGTHSNWYVYNAASINSLSSASRSIEDAEDIDSPSTYVNPTATFSGKISRDSNGRIAKISFTQQ